MRTITDTLKAAQQSGAKNVLVKLVLTHDSTTYTYTKILDIKETEDGPLQSCELVLNNSDGTLTDIDLRGYKGVLSFGAVAEYSACAPMWVLAQEFDSDPNKLECTLSLVGICNLMAQDEASAAYQPDDTDTKTVKTLVNEIIGATLACFNHCTAYQVEWDTGYDDLADTYKPKDAFRVYVGNNRLSAINRLLEYTKNVAVVKNDGKIHIFKPTTSGETYDSEYSLESGHTFFAKALRNRLVTPNYIKVQSREDDDPQYSGTAQDDSYAKLPKSHFKRTYLESNAQATAIAEAMLARAQMWCEAGAANVPLNVGAETFDYVKVTDERENDYRVGNIGRLVRHYDVRTNEWRMTFVFGNWQNVRKALDQLGITADDLENYFARLSVGTLYAEKLLAKNMGFYWLDPDNTIASDKLGPGFLDNLPDGEQYVRTSTWNMEFDDDPESPTYEKWVLKLDEHTFYQPGYDPNEKRRTFTSTPTTPYDIGDLWLDADTVKRCTTARASGAYVSGDWMATTMDAIENGELFSRVKSASLTAEGLVLLDQVQEGTFGVVKKASLSAQGLVLLDQVVDGTYGRVKSTDITAGHIKLSHCYGDLDDIDNGSTYGKLKTTSIDAGSILLNSYTKISGEWYDEAGVEIDAAHGINIYGQNNALTTRATKTGTIQCYVGSDGCIYAGAGNVKLDSSGIKLYGEMLKFYYGSSYRGYLAGTATSLNLHATTGYNVSIAGKEIAIVAVDGDIKFTTSGQTGIDMTLPDYLLLPRRTSAPTSPSDGMLVYNSTTHQTNVYRSGIGWQHYNYDAGWA